jgi:hypothetical protein
MRNETTCLLGWGVSEPLVLVLYLLKDSEWRTDCKQAWSALLFLEFGLVSFPLYIYVSIPPLHYEVPGQALGHIDRR